jgi:hypothetical protein
VRAEIEERADNTVVGTMSAKWNDSELSRTCPFSSAASDISYGPATVTGTTGGFAANSQFNTTNAEGTGFGSQAFTGTLSNGVISGTWTLGAAGFKAANGSGGSSSPTGSVAVRLTK